MSNASNGAGQLVERAGQRISEPALIQNGSAPTEFSNRTIDAGLVERAGQRTAEPALIQNGSTPTTFSSKTVRA